VRTTEIGTSIIIGGTALFALLPSPILAQDDDGFTGSLTVGGQIETGQAETDALSLTFTGTHPYSDSGSFSVGADLTYAQYEVDHVRATVADDASAVFRVEQNYGDRWVAMVSLQTRTNEVYGVDYRVEQTNGFGVRLQKGAAAIRIVPGVSFMAHDKGVPAENGFNFNYGFYQDLTMALTPMWNLTQYAYASKDPVDPDDYTYNFDVTLTGAFTERYALSVSFQNEHESLRPVGIAESYGNMQVGLQISF